MGTHIVDNCISVRPEDVGRHRRAHVAEPYEADPGDACGQSEDTEDGDTSAGCEVRQGTQGRAQLPDLAAHIRTCALTSQKGGPAS